MSDHGPETTDEPEQPSSEGTDGRPSATDESATPADATGVYGTAGWHPADDEESAGPPTAVYGTPGAAAPQWATPGEAHAPQPTTVQPIPGQPGPAQPGPAQWSPTSPPAGSPPTQAVPQAQPAVAYAAPQPMPTVPAQQVQAGYAPAPYPVAGPRHWNLWAGVPAAAAVFALGYLWRLIKIGTTAFDFPARQQFAIGVQAAAVVIGLLTLVALASRKRALAAPMAFLLGGLLLVDVVYGWYLQMDSVISGFDADFVFDNLIPITLPLVLLALGTIVAALVMRVDPGR